MFEIQGRCITASVDEKKAILALRLASGAVWEASGRAYVELTNGAVYYLDEAPVRATAKESGTWRGYAAEYTLPEGLTLHTLVSIERTNNDLCVSCRMEGDTRGQIKLVAYPAAFDFNGTEAGHGYTVLPRMQGTLVPAGEPIQVKHDMIFSREAYMPIFGQVRDGSGYLAIVETPFDAELRLEREEVRPLFHPSLGSLRYTRKMRYRFMENCDYNRIAKSYRTYLEERGEIVTLSEKCVKNPSVERMLGTPVISCDMISVHIHPDSHYYRPDDPQNNDHHTTFDAIAEGLTALRARGLERGYLHLDGWGRHGYDNLHPDPFPPSPEAGGAEGMRRLSDTARTLGYLFGIHDQYRDYYYDAPSFDFANAIENIDGSHPFDSTWYGGPQTVLCAELAQDYVRRNYDELARLGIGLDAAYLDVFSVVPMDECFHPDHPMSREACAAARNRCFDFLTSRGIIPSSEEFVGCMMKTLVLCHHAPYFTSKLGDPRCSSVGIHVPLFNLVYHDCGIIPWVGRKGVHGGHGIPGTDSGWLHALLNGNPLYCPIDADETCIAEVREACEIAHRLAKQRMLRHEFIDGSLRRQRTVWEDGTVIEVDFDTDEYRCHTSTEKVSAET